MDAEVCFESSLHLDDTVWDHVLRHNRDIGTGIVRDFDEERD